ncbi:MAG: aminotransferase class V-fold PLP-dependent enzyme [Pseudomonadales bacterium]
MANIYQQLGIRTIINAKGFATRVSGGLMPPAVAQAMLEATQHCVDMTELQGRASEIIAEHTGAEAGIVTSGAAAGLLLGTAACVTRLDPAKMNRLPDTTGCPNQVVMVRSQRNFYDHAVRATGVELVEVGLADRFAGTGVRDTEAWEIADAINERTACVFYVAQPHSRPSLGSITEVAHGAGVPVLVDAAAQLPPVDNLRRFIAQGADLVAFSGGKAIQGPQGTGILAGRRELVGAALLQNIDHDLFLEQWRPPQSLFKDVQLRGLPQHGIGRSCKVGKEQVVAALVALRQFDEEGVEVQHRACHTQLEELIKNLEPKVAAMTSLVTGGQGGPVLTLRLDDATAAFDLVIRLQDGDPCIHTDPTYVDDGKVDFTAICLAEGEHTEIARRLNEILG